MQAILRLHVTQRRRQICACAVCLLIAPPVRSAEIAVKLTGPPQIVPRVSFGMHMHRVDAGTPWPNIPFGTWRLLDAYVNWLNLQPARDRWDFAKLDRYVSLAENARVEILLPLAYAPAWAPARPTEPGPYGPGTAAEPANLEDWRNYVRTVASRYRGRSRQRKPEAPHGNRACEPHCGVAHHDHRHQEENHERDYETRPWWI